MTLPFHQLLMDYIHHFSSPNSKLAYIRDLKQYQEWCAQKGEVDLLGIDNQFASSYRDYLALEFSDKTMQRKLSVVKGLYKLATEKMLIDRNPFYEVRPPEKKEIRKKIKPLDTSEVERILLFPNLKTEEGHRDYVMIYLLFSLGLKIGEVVNIHRSDFKKYETGLLLQVRKWNGKNYYSKVPLNCQEVVNPYLQKWGVNDFLFKSLAKNKTADKNKDKPLTARSGWVIVKNYLKKGRLDLKGRTTNCAREFFIHHLIEEGVSAEVLRKVLGLKSLNAVRRYGVSELKTAVELLTFKDHPVDKIRLQNREY